MRLLLTLLLLTGLSANAQPLWRNFFTTNQNPRVTVVAGSNATVQASTVGFDQRIFTVNAVPGAGTGQTNNTIVIAGTNGVVVVTNSSGGITTYTVHNTNIAGISQTNWPLSSITNANYLTNWALIPTNFVPAESTHTTNADFVITATLTNKMYASNVVSGGQVPIAALSGNNGADGWFLIQSNSTAVWGLNGASLTNIGDVNYATNTAIATNVISSGAKGDGANDDQPAVQSAISGIAAAGGGMVYFPPGTYKINNSLTIPSNVRISGSGWESTIYCWSNIPCLLLQGTAGTPVTNVVIERIHLLGGGTVATNDYGLANYNTMIQITSFALHVLVNEVWSDSAGYDGINILADCDDVTIANCRVSGCQDDGINPGGGTIVSTGTKNTRILNNIIENNRNDGIHISGGSYNTTAIGNTIINSADGVGLYNTSSNIISDNTLIGNGYGVMQLYEASYANKIHGNTIFCGTNGTGTYVGSGIYLATGSAIDGTSIQNNTIVGAKTNAFGIYVSSGRKVSVVGNVIDGGLDGIRLYSMHFTSVLDNIVTNALQTELIAEASTFLNVSDNLFAMPNQTFNNIALDTVTDSFFSCNNIMGGNYGIDDQNGARNVFNGNKISKCVRGLNSYSSPKGHIIGNHISNIRDIGVALGGGGVGSALINGNYIFTITNYDGIYLNTSSNLVSGNYVTGYGRNDFNDALGTNIFVNNQTDGSPSVPSSSMLARATLNGISISGSVAATNGLVHQGKHSFFTNFTVVQNVQIYNCNGTNQVITLPNCTNSTAWQIYRFSSTNGYAKIILTNANGLQTIRDGTSLSFTQIGVGEVGLYHDGAHWWNASKAKTIFPVAQFSTSTNIPLTAANTAYPVTFNSTDFNNSQGIALGVGTNGFHSKMWITNSGQYEFGPSIVQSFNGNDTIRFWFRKFDTNIAKSATPSKGQNGSIRVITVPFIVNVTEPTPFEIWAESDSTGEELLAGSASGNYPAAPSVICPVKRVSDTWP